MTEETAFVLPETVTYKESRIPPWRVRRCELLKLTDRKKGSMDEIQVQCAFTDVKQQYHDYSFIYSDGAKNQDGVGCAYVHTWK